MKSQNHVRFHIILVINRLGRGYNFEALRAKILATEGVHSKSRSRPKFERKRELADMGRGTSFYVVPPGHIGKVIFDDDHQH